MEKIKQIAILAISFGVTYFVVKYAVIGYQSQNYSSKMESSMETMKQEAVAANPNLTASEALAKVAKEQSETKLANLSSSTKLSSAVDMFFGFYYVNVKWRKEYCDKLGVDISPFISAFKRANAPEYQIMVAEHQQRGVNVDFFLSKSDTTMTNTINQAMADAKTQLQAQSTKEVCELMRDNSDAFANEMTTKKVHPSLYSGLHGM